MASLVKRGNRYYVVFKYTDQSGERKQKWESYKTMPEAKARKKELEYKEEIGTLSIPPCTTLDELLTEYISVYGRNKWAMSTYSSNVALIDHYIRPFIGDLKLADINPRVLERFYQKLLKTEAVGKKPKKPGRRKEPVPQEERVMVSPSTIRDVHKILHNCFEQARKWELMERNPASLATVPKYQANRRDIWTAETLFHAIDLCEDSRLKLALHLAFSCSLRIGELLGLTWDCVDISESSIKEGKASITVNKELQRVNRESVDAVENPEILLVFPTRSAEKRTALVLKSPKTKSSFRKVYLPKTVAEFLVDWKKDQDYVIEALGDEYHDYDLVMAGPLGYPTEASTLTDSFRKLIRDNDLPPVVFHSLRHSSITYKLKLNGGDVKAVQGDSGHAQATMVTEVYSHILDDDRQHNAELFEETFYSGKTEDKKGAAPGGVGQSSDMEAIMRILKNPEAAKLLKSLLSALDDK